MATVYLQPGSGTGSGTLADPYYYNEIVTAHNAATSTGTVDGVVVLTDGDYEHSANKIIGNLSSSSTVTLEFKALNTHQASFKNTSPTACNSLEVGTSSSQGFIVKLTGVRLDNYSFYCKGPAEAFKLKQVVSGVTQSANACFRGSDAVTLNECEFYYAPTASSLVIFNRADNTTMNGCTLFFDTSGASSTSNVGASPETYKNTIISSNNGSAFTADLFGVSGMTNCCVHNVYATSGGTNNIFADPQLVDVSSSNVDFRLRPSSPCINAGTAS